MDTVLTAVTLSLDVPTAGDVRLIVGIVRDNGDIEWVMKDMTLLEWQAASRTDMIERSVLPAICALREESL